jgi:hypothetical protein
MQFPDQEFPTMATNYSKNFLETQEPYIILVVQTSLTCNDVLCHLPFLKQVFHWSRLTAVWPAAITVFQ